MHKRAGRRSSPWPTGLSAFLCPAVLIIAVITFLGWMYHGAPVARSMMNAVSVMVIACPCALGLATPLAILIGTSNAAAQGILIKGGDVIEKAASVDFVVLDKTGTITEGKPVLSEAHGIGISDEQALRLALSLEQRSEHSLARAIVESGRGLEPYEVTDFSALPGRGIRGMIAGKEVLIGSREFIQSEHIALDLDAAMDADQRRKIIESEKSGATITFLYHDGDLRGVFAISDRMRQEAAEAVTRLRTGGLSVAMVTGDNLSTAEAVAKKTGIEMVKAQVSPMEKAVEIQRLEHDGKHVLMAGDGINDAPALVAATIGVAMGRATDIALESADIVIMRSDLRLVADAVTLAKKTFSIIRQNIFWAFFYNIVVIPIAIFGILHPIVAAGAMAFSSLSVVGNSLRARLR